MRANEWRWVVVAVCAVMSAGFYGLVHGQNASTEGRQIYETNCASCHENAVFKAPTAVSLGTMSHAALMAAMTTGQMATQAAELSRDEKIMLAELLTQRPWQSQSISEASYCDNKPKASNEILWSGWGGDVRSTGNSATSEINRDNIDTLDIAWVFGFPGATRSRSQPAVVDNLIVIGSQLGQAYALDLGSGCIHWIFDATSAIRGAISSAKLGGRMAVFFADFRTNVYAVDILTGEAIWQTKVGHDQYSSVTGSVTVADDRIYVPIASTEVIAAADPNHICCTSSGAVVALSMEDGGILWRHLTIPQTGRAQVDLSATRHNVGPSGAPVWSSPTVDTERGLVFVGTGQNYSRPGTATSDAILALDVDSGELVWSFQGFEGDAFNIACVIPGREDNCPEPPNPDVDFGMAPIVAHSALLGDVLVAGQKSGVVHVLDPDTGKPRWQRRIGLGGPNGGIHWGMSISGERILATVSDRLSGIARVDPEGQPMPGIYALDLDSGEIDWNTPAVTDTCRKHRGCYAAYSAAPSGNSELAFSGGLDGWMRAFDVNTGKAVWQFETVQKFETINDVDGIGGSIDGPGPVLVRNTLLVNSGYGLNEQMPGNVLIAFKLRK